MKRPNTTDIGFEDKIREAADKMCGNIYKSVALRLIFLKYISDKFKIKYRQLVAEGRIASKFRSPA